MGKMPRIFVLCFLICVAAFGTILSTGRAVAASSSSNSDELEELLDANGDETQVETEQEYALPVPKSAEENAPTLSEADQGPINPGDRNSEDLFLPVPSDQVGLPAVEGEASDDFMPFFRAGDVRHDSTESRYRKPGFTMFGGVSGKQYATSVVGGTQQGLEIGLNGRILGWSLFRMPMSLHALGAITFTSLNDVTQKDMLLTTTSGTTFVRDVTANSVKERLYRVGPMLEWELSRRFQLFGGVFKYFNEFNTSGANYPEPSGTVGAPPTFIPVDANVVLSQLKENRFTFGGGIEWDFYVIPHASFGLRGWLEPRYASLTLTFSAEPRPRNRTSLDVDEDD